MTKTRKPRISPIEQRKQQIQKEIDKIYGQAATKTRQSFKTEKGFEQWKQAWPEKISELQNELSILNDPGEYAALPYAVVAEELGISLCEINSLVSNAEIAPIYEIEYGEEIPTDRISREEMEKAIDIGVDELLRRSEQEVPSIFEEAIQYFQDGNIEQAKKAHKRLQARQRFGSPHEDAIGIALSLAKGQLEEALSSLRSAQKYDEHTELTAMLTYLGRLLKVMRLEEHGAEALREQLLAFAEGKGNDPYRYFSHEPRQFGKRQDEVQQRAMYIATVVQSSLEKYRSRHRFMRYDFSPSSMQEEEFYTLIQSAIYTALQAEATYEESAASKSYVDSIKSQIPRWWSPARLLEHLPKTKDKTQSPD